MKRPIRLGFATLVLLTANSAALGYEKDVHFSLTYAACVLTGQSDSEALEVASADERMDENDTTTASVVVAFERESFEAQKRRRWHSLDDSRDAVLARLDELWNRAVRGRSLVYFGQYLHFLQDHYSHRESTGANWKPYGWKIGHAVRAHQPDRVPSDRKLAIEMVQATLDAAKRFTEEALGRTPTSVREGAAARLVEALAGAYSADSFGFWNEADSYKSPIKLEEALLDLGTLEAHVPHVGRIIKMRFDRDGERIGER
jgi:hypothetical protein